ncbi:MAG: FkbM family methyltransferase [Actinomycetota bacterium]|nr:FkbM family methyltransferase [Actinomycetota bacterium]
MDNTLIYDVGMNTGDDTAYYLHRGYSVVAIEANPELAEHGKSRFAREISDGRAVVLNVGIAENDGELDFWVCEDNDVWSSFDRSRLLLYEVRHHSVRVKTRTFSSILDEYGVPFYCKVDIEGHEHICIEQLTPSTKPRYISIEMTEGRWPEDIRSLRELGYDAFKVIDQMSFRVPWRWSPLDAGAGIHPAIANTVARVRTKVHWTRRPKMRDWSFPWDASGPFGEDTPGRWLGVEEAIRLCAALQDRSEKRKAPLWYDIHAAVRAT